MKELEVISHRKHVEQYLAGCVGEYLARLTWAVLKRWGDDFRVVVQVDDHVVEADLPDVYSGGFYELVARSDMLYGFQDCLEFLYADPSNVVVTENVITYPTAGFLQSDTWLERGLPYTFIGDHVCSWISAEMSEDDINREYIGSCWWWGMWVLFVENGKPLLSPYNRQHYPDCEVEELASHVTRIAVPAFDDEAYLFVLPT